MQKQPKILIAEDDALVAADLQATLSGYGYDVPAPVASGEEVLATIESLRPNFVLMDINLAGSLDGIQTAEAIQQLFPVPLVFLTALNDESTLQRAKLVRPFGYLIKPFDGPELRSTIELTLHRYALENNNPVEDDTRDLAEPSTQEITSSAQQCAFLSTLALFDGIALDAVEQLCQSARMQEHDAGEFLVQEGSSAKSVFIPISGRVNITKTSSSGKELIVALLARGDPFGCFYTFAPFASSTSARTQTISKILYFPTAKWSYFADRNPQLYRNLALALSERLTAAHTLSSSLAHDRVEGRIVNTLLALVTKFGRAPTKEPSIERIFITRKELAELTGTTPETAIRITKNLERSGLLDLTRPGIIKIPKLKSLEELARA